MESTTVETSFWWPAARFVIGLGGAIALSYGALFLAFMGLVVISGCFWACSQPDPQPVFGVLLLGAAVAAAGGAVTSLVAGAVGRKAWLKWVYAGSASIATIVLLLGSTNG